MAEAFVMYRAGWPDALVAQLDRAPDFESGGQGFESLPARQFPNSSPINRNLITLRARNANHDVVGFLVLGQAQIAVIGIAGRQSWPGRGALFDGHVQNSAGCAVR